MATPDLKNQIYRKTALDRLASPDQLDHLVTVADAKGWAAAAGIGVMLAVLAGWGALGRIPTTVPADGIVVTRGGRVLGAMSPAVGIVDGIAVKIGDTVAKGQTVAVIRQVEAERKLAGTRQVVEERTATLERRRVALAGEMELRRANLRQRKQAQEQAMAAAEQRVAYLSRQKEGREALLQRGFTTNEKLEEVRAELNHAWQSISDGRAKLFELDAAAIETQLAHEKELNALQDALADAQRTVRELETHIAHSTTVEAPGSGRTTEIAVTEGTIVNVGTPILSIEAEGQGLQAVVYIPTEHGKKVRPGMTVRIAPATARREEHGMLLGRVAAVSAFPVTPQGMAAVLQNPRLVDGFAKAGPPYEARIDLFPADTPSGYAWTSGRGLDALLTSGTTVSSEITVQEVPPLDLILPLLRKALGILP